MASRPSCGKASRCKYEFVSEYAQSTSNEFHCPVCSEILKDPFLTTCCGVHFCKACIEITKKKTKRCPLCEEAPINAVADKRFQRIMDELQVYCSQKKHGCLWVGTLDELREHLANDVEGCQYASMACSVSCGTKVTTEIQEHLPEEANEEREEEDHDQPRHVCEFCKFSSVCEDDITQHHSSCPNLRIPCPYSCNKNIKQRKLDQHLRTCPNAIVPCTFNEMGCRERMKRYELQQHIEANVLYHQLIMCEAFKEIKKENEMLKKDNKMLQRTNEELKRDIQVSKNTQNTVDYWINGFKMMAEEVKRTHWREYLSLAITSTNIPEPVSPVIFKWSNYTAVLQKAKKKPIFYYFRPFYTHKGGYKMQLRVYPNGIGYGKGTHVSLCCCIMRGENDDELGWPFKGTVKVTLLNQVINDNHHCRQIWELHSEKPTEVDGQPAHNQIRNETGWGPMQFISLADIEYFTDHKQYLMNDTLYLQVTATSIF